MYTCEQCKFFPDCEKVFYMNLYEYREDGVHLQFASEVEKKCDEFGLSEEYSARVYKRQYVNYDGTLTDFALRSLSAMEAMNDDRITDKFLDTLSDEQLTALTLKIFEAQRRREKN